MDYQPKILITGTGRCGTTFLITLFTFLQLDTGFTKENYKKYIFANCGSGMEKLLIKPPKTKTDIPTLLTDTPQILKNPAFIDEFEQIVELELKIKLVIIPIRDYSCSAKSRVSHNKLAGGLWNASDEDSQIVFYNKIMANYIYIATKHEIDTIFLNFDKMVSDGKYLFDKLGMIIMENNIGFDAFVAVFNEVNALFKK